jgi:hydrogenase-4 component B
MTAGLVTIAAAFGAGAAAGVCWPTREGARRLSLTFAVVGALAALLVGARELITGIPVAVEVARPLSAAGGFAFHLDRLGAWFLLIIGLTGLPATLFAFGSLRHADRDPRARVGLTCYSVFLAAMCLVVAAGNAFTFLLGWELMAVSSYLLIVTTGLKADVAPAGLWYAVMSQVGLLALLAAFVTLSQGGSLDFASLRDHAATLSPAATRTVLWLTVVAFGSKAGLVPLHAWLPRAHPAAPSHVSALMSSAMVSLGVYGCVRVLFDLLPANPSWWGGALLAAGIATALTGVLYAVADTNLKRVLAYSTIENIGLVFVGLGFALLMRSSGLQTLATAGLVIGLLHTLNHAVFKTLLFLCAGAVAEATHDKSLESYGGLLRRMPHTAVLCLIGALALAALPPFNGFPSEWLTFQLLITGARGSAPELAIWLPLCVAGVALVAGLAAVAAVRLFGMTFLALPRTPRAADAREVAPIMRLAMCLPAGVSVVLGLAPHVPLAALQGVATGLHLPTTTFGSGQAVRLAASGSQMSPLGLAVVLTSVATLLLAFIAKRTSLRHRRTGPAWGCGRAVQTARSEYTAAAFAEPLRRVFAAFYRPRQEVTIQAHPDSRYFVRSIAFRSDLRPWIEQVFYTPMVQATRWASLRTRRLQTGSINLYLALIPVALIVLLFLAGRLP